MHPGAAASSTQQPHTPSVIIIIIRSVKQAGKRGFNQELGLRDFLNVLLKIIRLINIFIYLISYFMYTILTISVSFLNAGGHKCMNQDQVSIKRDQLGINLQFVPSVSITRPGPG